MKFAQAMIGVPAPLYVEIAKIAEDVGFDSIAISDHVVFPEKLESEYPYSATGRPQYEPQWDFPDPWVAVGAMAAATERLHFFTNVFVLPARNPLLVAKTVGTASVLSGGRVGLGIGAGWMREEFELLEQPFSRRGKRMDEMIEVMRTLWGGGFVEHHGAEYDFEPVDMRPAPSAPIPIFVGGHSEVALKRAARLDGWIGVNYSMERLAELCEQLHAYRRELGTDPAGPYEIVASPLAAPTPENVEQLEAMGVTTVLTSAWMAFRKPAPRTLEEAREVLSAYAERFINPLRGTN